MAYVRKMANGSWQAQIQHLGKRTSRVFKTKGEASYWANNTQKQVKEDVAIGVDNSKLFVGLLDRYAQEVSVQKLGGRTEAIRLKAIAKSDHFANLKISQVNSDVVSRWRDSRLKDVSPATALRELKLLSSVFSKAIREWRVIKENPVKMIDKPRSPPPRDKLISQAEIDAFLGAIPYSSQSPATSLPERVAVAFLFAIESAMRCGEICSLTPKSINGNVARLMMTKNGERRDVPLSKEAVRLLGLLPKTDGPLFGLKSSQVDTTFRKIRSGIKGADYTFHDTRHLAVTRLSKKVDAMTLARIAGHKNLAMTLRYFNPDVKELAKLLD